MRIKTLMITVSLGLFFLATAQIARAQKDGEPKDGEAQMVIFNVKDHPTLKFSNKRPNKQGCGLLVNYTQLDNQEEAFVVKVAHLHFARLRLRPTLPETGWLYITPSRIIFNVEIGDKSHGFNVPRTALNDKQPAEDGFGLYPGLQINLMEKLAASDSSEQKFVFFTFGYKKCYVDNPGPYKKFLVRAVNDFNGAMTEFKQVAASLKESGKVQQPLTATPPPRVDFKVP